MYILALMAVSGPSLRLARRSAERTKPPYADAASANAAFACICSSHIVGARRMSSDRSFARFVFLQSDPTTAFVVPYLVRQGLNSRSFLSHGIHSGFKSPAPLSSL